MRQSVRNISLILVAMVALGGCSNMSQRQQAVVSGAAIGAAGGAVIGNQAGNPVTGAVIGAGVGAATGFFINRHNGAED